MEISYSRDNTHNYLVIDTDEADTENYQYKMIENNEIAGIIPFSLRSMDGKKSFYYEMDFGISLENKYSVQKMTYEKLVKFLECIVDVTDNLSEFFLDEERLLIRPDCIFEDLTTGEYSFIYYPAEIGGQDDLGEMLLEITDMKDDKASRLAYSICEGLSEGPSGKALFIKKVLEEEVTPYPKREPWQEMFYEIDEKDDESDEEDEDEEIENRVIKIHIPFGMSMIMAILFAIVAGVLWYLRVAFILTYEENILDIAVFMVAVMMSLICLIQALKKKKHSPMRDLAYQNDEDEEVEEYEADEEDRKENLPEKHNNDFFTPGRDVISEEDDEEEEETVFLSMDFESITHKLYRTGDMGGDNIILDVLPLTIGKLAKYTDAVIRDPSVSRIHARIFRTGKDLFVQDLNSKNGTFVNGKRLLPNEKAPLFPDDEVSFGKCTFSYR